MKTASLRTRTARFLSYCLVFLGIGMLSPGLAQGQGSVPCPPNIDFENGDLSSWECWLGSSTTGNSTAGVTFSSAFISGPQPTRHIIKGPLGTPPELDPWGKFPVVPAGGGSYALKLGRDSALQAAERVRYYVHVPANFNDYSFNFRFAVVLEDAGHTPDSQPAFRIKATDSATGIEIPCANQNYIASQQLISIYGFRKTDSVGFENQVIYLPWTSGALPIIGQGGKTVIIEVEALGCSQSGHWGYGYFDVISCGKYKAAVTFCDLDAGIVRFIGTGVTQDYNWYTSNWTFIGKGPFIDAPIPSTPDFFYGVRANGSPGCLDTIVTDTVSDFLLNAIPEKTCVFFGNAIQLEAQTTGGVGGFSYNWDPNPDLSSTTIYNPTAIPNDTTKYYVTVADKHGCFRRDSVIVDEAPNAGLDIPVCPLGDRPAQLHVYGPTGVDYSWYDEFGNPAQYLSCTDCIDPVAAPPTPVYTYTVGYEGCSVLDTIVVYHDTTNYIVAPQDPLLVCRPQFVELQSIPYGPFPRVNLPCGIANTITCAPTDQDTATVGYGAMPPKTPFNTPFLTERSFTKYQFIIPKEEIFRAGFYSGTINSMTFRSLNPALLNNVPIDQIIVSIGCTDDRTFIDNPTNATFSTALTNVATLTGYALTANDWNQITFSQPYNWDTSKNIIVDLCIGQLTPNTNGLGLEPFAMVPGAAIQKYDNQVNVCGGNASAGNIRRYYQRPVVQFLHCPTPDLPFEFTWRPGAFLSDSTVQNPRVYVQSSMDLAVYSVGRNGCQMRDELHIIQPEHDLTLQPQDTFICKGQPAFMRATGANQGYQWYEVNGGSFTDASGSLSCTDCPNPTAVPMQTTTYAVVYSNDIGVANPNNDNFLTGCPDTLQTTVNVWDLPNVRINNMDTTISFGQSVQLYVLGASNYVWTPSGSLSDPNSPAPLASPAQTTNYIVTGADSNGCTSRDTVTVAIDFHKNLLVPTAFTPNGDGLNDEFKIVNASFQRLMEFRVFNRWGQEVFSTTNINKGWDGTWKGVPQEMAAYQYIIRVAIPDGNTEMYKGDVTLIR